MTSRLKASAFAATLVGMIAHSAFGQAIPPERPRARPPSELTGWAEWERAAEIFSRVKVPPSPPLSPEEAQKTFRVAPGFRLELVAAEPLVIHPIFFEFDPDGRIWVVEYQGYMRDLEGRGEGDPLCRIVVLEDTTGDGRADRSTVFLDGLVMPRTLALVKGGVLVAEPPNLWFCADTNSDLRADTKKLVGPYGRAGNPQHTANGLTYGLDNWLHSADWERRHRFENGPTQQSRAREQASLVEEPALYRGQFGVSFDEFGRFVTCRESSPAEMDFIPEEYLRRNSALVRAWQRGRQRERFGIAVPIGRGANECFPIRPTPGITLGALELRDDGTLRTYTIVAGTAVYLGDQFPADAYGNIFVPEAGGHLIGRLRVSGGMAPRAERYYPAGQEILASTDERFRPMSARTGPDGALYFADMYKGIIEHVIFMAPYIADQIKERGLALGNDMGRIYRLVSTEKPIDRTPPRLSSASSATLVKYLGHANGWWRITAQRLLVERRDASVAPGLRELARSRNEGTNHLRRLHALWTLDGMAMLDWQTAMAASSDPHEFVRAAALRLGERLLTNSTITARSRRREEAENPDANRYFSRLQAAASDPSEIVRLQTALSLGAWPAPEAEAAMVRILDGHDSPLFRTAVLSGLSGRERRFLDRLESAWHDASERRKRFLQDFAEVIFHGRDAALIARLLDLANEQTGALAWRRASLIEGLLSAAPADLSATKPIALATEPRVISALLTSGDRAHHEQAWRLSELFTWPGRRSRDREGAWSATKPLTPEQEKLFVKGQELYTQLCAPCHQPHGGGLPALAPPLNGTEWVAGSPDRLVRIVLHGLYGPLQIAGTEWNHHMPGFYAADLTDDAFAAVLTYVRRAWENTGEPVEPSLVAQVRAATADRQLPWTPAELGGRGSTRAPVEPDLIRPAANGELRLPARLAVCFGAKLAYRPALDILAPWRHEHDIATWRVEVPVARVYDVFITLAADDASAGDHFLVESDAGRVRGTVRSTGGYERFQEIHVGPLPLRKGINRILVRPDGKLRAELADIKALRLVPSNSSINNSSSKLP
jgi:putative membrane-bound dehydrogenase-like protein